MAKLARQRPKKQRHAQGIALCGTVRGQTGLLGAAVRAIVVVVHRNDTAASSITLTSAEKHVSLELLTRFVRATRSGAIVQSVLKVRGDRGRPGAAVPPVVTAEWLRATG